MNILLIEDNINIIKGLSYSFKKEGLNLIYKRTLKEAEEYLKNTQNIDLILLDITLPDGDGLNLFKTKLKELNIPVIFLTIKDEEDIIVESLNLGAEDYITKPFSTKELLARINRTLLRTKKNSKITVKDITFDIDKLIIYKKDKQIELTPLELKIISLLFTNINKVVTRDLILDKIWEWTGNFVDNHTVTVYIKRIREKLQTDIIKTIKGIGYRIDEK